MVGYEMNELNEGATSADADGFRAKSSNSFLRIYFYRKQKKL